MTQFLRIIRGAGCHVEYLCSLYSACLDRVRHGLEQVLDLQNWGMQLEESDFGRQPSVYEAKLQLKAEAGAASQSSIHSSNFHQAELLSLLVWQSFK